MVCKPETFTSGKYTCTKLKWYEIGGVKKSKGDLLAAFELFKLGDGGMELPLMPPFEDRKYLVPPEISPKKKLMRVEVRMFSMLFRLSVVCQSVSTVPLVRLVLESPQFS